jgi:hypothetical protein
MPRIGSRATNRQSCRESAAVPRVDGRATNRRPPELVAVYVAPFGCLDCAFTAAQAARVATAARAERSDGT